MGSRANDQSGTYIICLFYPALFTLFLKGREERNSVADGPFLYFQHSYSLTLHQRHTGKYIQPTNIRAAEAITNKNLKSWERCSVQWSKSYLNDTVEI